MNSHAEGEGSQTGLATMLAGYSVGRGGLSAHAEGGGAAIGDQSHAEGSSDFFEMGRLIYSKSSVQLQGIPTIVFEPAAGCEEVTLEMLAGQYFITSHLYDTTPLHKINEVTDQSLILNPSINANFFEGIVIANASGFALGSCSHVEGQNVIASGEYQHAQGRYNLPDTNSAFIIGNGFYDDGPSRSNALTVDWQGNLNVSGELSSATGADYAEYFEWLDGNPLEEDRIGYLVALNEDKIEYANSGDDILGIVSGTAAVVGDTAVWDWQDKYLTDDFGRTIWDMVEEFSEVPEIEEVEIVDEEGNATIEYKTTMVTKSMGFFPHRRLNPNYDDSQTYIPRSKRPEWDCIGLMGKLHVRDDGTCVPGGYATAGANGIATYSSEKTNMKVMKRLSDNIILVFMK